MEILSNTNLFIVISAALLVFTLYLFVVLKIKRKDGRTLNAENNALTEAIDLQKKEYKELNEKLDQLKSEMNHLLELESNETKMRKQLEEARLQLNKTNEKIGSLAKQESELSDNITSIKEDISIYQPVHGLMNVGFFEEPEYLYETS